MPMYTYTGIQLKYAVAHSNDFTHSKLYYSKQSGFVRTYSHPVELENLYIFVTVR